MSCHGDHAGIVETLRNARQRARELHGTERSEVPATYGVLLVPGTALGSTRSAHHDCGALTDHPQAHR